ncbi:MAG TPA: nucleotidyltransferase family protein [Pyrinomonadaceae bacterium]|nr:nucleotidyltransferase family protein [Pyrinomonadaceae bacterium]
MSRILRAQGELLARALRGCWRAGDLPPLDLSETELDQITPLLMGSGAAPLGWRVVDGSPLRESPSGELLHQAYRLQTLQAEIQEQKIEKVFRLLREASLDAILAKGWAAAKLYPNRTLRPYGDIDICVRPGDYQAVSDVFRSPEGSDCWIDLHRNFSEIGNRTVDELFSRSKMHRIGQEQVRVLGDEDHVALLCIHLLKHGAWRPLWLCDVAAAMESPEPNFDWELCLGRDTIRASWIQSAFGLAHRILGATTKRLPLSMQTLPVPEWLVDTVLKQWSNPFARYQAPMNHPVPMAEVWRQPSELIEGLRQRWPNPIIATISVHGRLNELPRLPYQLANCVARVVRFVVPHADELQEH